MAQPLARASPSPRLGRLVAGDPAQPRQRVVVLGSVAAGALQRDREDVRREVRGQLAVARLRQQHLRDRRQVPAVEGREGVAVAVGGRGQQRGVVADVRCRAHLPASCRRRRDCDSRRRRGRQAAASGGLGVLVAVTGPPRQRRRDRADRRDAARRRGRRARACAAARARLCGGRSGSICGWPARPVRGRRADAGSSPSWASCAIACCCLAYPARRWGNRVGFSPSHARPQRLFERACDRPGRSTGQKIVSGADQHGCGAGRQRIDRRRHTDSGVRGRTPADPRPRWPHARIRAAVPADRHRPERPRRGDRVGDPARLRRRRPGELRRRHARLHQRHPQLPAAPAAAAAGTRPRRARAARGPARSTTS